MDEPRASFAGYRLEQLLVTDTVSATYRAISETRSRQRRPVALRISRPLHTSGGHDDNAIAAFLAVVNAAAAVNHPGLATIHDAGESGGRVYVATDPVAADTLDEYIRHHGPLPASHAIPLLVAIAEGLDGAHVAGVVHGAISPRTIYVHRRRTDARTPPAILTGFGLETLLARQGRANRDRIHVADVCYVAPELLGGSSIDGRADQYALACAVYHCIAGRPPFVRDAVAAMFGAHLFSEAQVPAGRGGDRTLGPAVAIGMSKQPGVRHTSCMALMRATGYVRAPRRAAAAVAAPRHSPPRPPRPPRPRRLPIAWPVAALLVLAGIVCTLVLAAVLRDDDVDTGAVSSGQQVRLGSLEIPDGDDGRPRPIGVGWQQMLTSEPIRTLMVAGRAVVAATDHGVFALDPSDGSARWDSQFDAGRVIDVAIAGRNAGVRAATLRGLSLDNGATRWESADVLAPTTSLVAADGILYGIRSDGVAPELVALDAASGARLWQFDGGSTGIDDDAVVGAAGGHVAVLQDGHLFVVDPPATTSMARPGSARWHVSVQQPWLRSLVVQPDAVMVATRDGQVCAYAPADGAQQWCAPIVGSHDHAPVIVANTNAVAVIMPFHVTGLARETGALRWIYDAHKELTPTVLSRGHDVVLTDVDGTLRGLDAAGGHERWRASGFGEITALAATVDAIYAGTSDSRVVCLRLDGSHQTV
jgi:serine/threonine-protein kinase